jgi:methionyl-tRNA formyltransferase
MMLSASAQNLRIVFAGTPDFAAAHLQAMIDAGCNIVSAYSQPDRPFGRGKKLKPTPVKAIAEAHAIPVCQPPDFRHAGAVAELGASRPDLMVVVAYGLLLPESVLGIPVHSCFNVHASLLPRWRGAAPIERAILAGDGETGVCIMQMEKGLDTGPVLLRESTPISRTDSSASLGNRLQVMGCRLLIQAIESLARGMLSPEPQDERLATYAGKIRKSESLIDWQASATSIDRLVRAMYPRSPAWCSHPQGRLRIIQAGVGMTGSTSSPGTVLEVSSEGVLVSCGEGSTILVTSVQPEGKGVMTVASLLNGHPDFFHSKQPLM